MTTQDTREPDQKEIRVILSSSKSTYHVREPLCLDIQIINISDRELQLEAYICFRKHVRLTITDEQGGRYEFPGGSIKVTIPGPQGLDDFVKIPPGQFIGALNCTDDEVVITHAGKYNLQVSYSSVGASSISEELGIEAWSGSVESAPIQVQVEDRGDPRFAGLSAIEKALEALEKLALEAG